MSRSTFWISALIFSVASPLAFADGGATTRPTIPSQAELDKKFEQTMNNATLAGSYTVGNANKPAAQDKYTLGSVSKKDGSADVWIIVAKIEFGAHSVALPLEIPVKWAGDTAVITVDNLGVPGIGQYTARVMIFGDQYTGIWGSSDGSHGGQMWGKIEHAAPTPAK